MNEPHHKILQASVCLRMVGTSATDAVLTQELEQNHLIAKNNIRAVKSLFPGKDGPLAPLRRLAGQARKAHINLTFEGFGESRLLVAAEHNRWMEKMRDFQNQFNALASEFIANYDAHLSAERVAKNGSFNEDDYPIREKLPEYFGFQITLLPLPEPNQFLRLALGDEMRQQYIAQADSAVQQIRKETFRTMFDLISQTAASLAGDGPICDAENKKGPLAKLREYLDRVPVLNLTGDAEIQSLYQAARTQLNASTEVLRENKFVRQQTASAAASIIQQFSSVSSRKLAV